MAALYRTPCPWTRGIVPDHSVCIELWQRHLLRDARTGTLGTIASGGMPQLVPVCFALVGGDIAIAIDEKPKQGRTLARLRNIERDPRVALLVDHYEERWECLAWVRLEGDALVVPSGAAWPEALAALRARYPQYRAMALERLPVVRIHPTRVVGWRAQGGARGSA